MSQRIYGHQDHDGAVSLCGLGQVYMAKGRLDDSAPLWKEPSKMGGSKAARQQCDCLAV